MNSIAQVNIRNTTLTLEGFRTLRTTAAISMRRFIHHPEIGFSFYNDTCCDITVDLREKNFTQKIFGQKQDILIQIIRKREFQFFLFAV